jgi:hypothetical protein
MSSAGENPGRQERGLLIFVFCAVCHTFSTTVPLQFDKATIDRLWRVMLRALPIPAGPELYDLLKGIKRSQTDFDKQVAQAVESLGSTSTLIATLQQSVEDQMAKLTHLREEHERYSELAQIEAKKAEALLKQVEKTLGREQAKERWIALAMHLGVGFLFFVLGVVMADPFRGWISHVWKRVH